LSTVAEWFGDDLTVSLLFNPGRMPPAEAERSIDLFAAKVAPVLSH